MKHLKFAPMLARSNYELSSDIKRKLFFYVRKLTGYQKIYTVTEKEILSIVEALKWFRIILLGQKLCTYTENKNITCNDFNTDRV